MTTVSFLTVWNSLESFALGPLPTPRHEYYFAPERKWRFDWAFPDEKVAIEFNGGQWVAHGGRHNRDSDRDKINTATAMGWRVLQFSNQQWEDDPLACCALVAQAMSN